MTNAEIYNMQTQIEVTANRVNRIEESKELLSLLGIRVVGRVDTEEELLQEYPAASYQGEYGDSILVGTEPPYDYYLFTRPFRGQVDSQWFNIGPFPVAGPQGEDGQPGGPGPQGKRGSLWFSGTTNPTTTVADPTIGTPYEVGDYYLKTPESIIFHLHDENGVRRWINEGSIRGAQGIQGLQGPQGPDGPQGPAGPQGPIGPIGPLVEIKGAFTSVDDLLEIDPNNISPQDAYLVKVNNTVSLWVVVGESPNKQWYELGTPGAGSFVTANGQFQSEWNADTKIDKFTQTGARRIYCVGSDGGQYMATLRPDIAPTNSDRRYQIVVRQNNTTGNITVPETPAENTDATSKYYVDNTATQIAQNEAVKYQHFCIFEISGSDTKILFTIIDKNQYNNPSEILFEYENVEMSCTGTRNLSESVISILFIDPDNFAIETEYGTSTTYSLDQISASTITNIII